MNKQTTHLSALIFEKAKQYSDKAALHYRNDATKEWIPISWNELAKQVKNMGKALASIGLQDQENVGIFSQNVCEIIVADFAVFTNHAVSVPLYATSTALQIEFIVNDAEIQVVFVGDQYQYDVTLEVKKTSKTLKKIIVIEGSVDLRNDPDSIYFSDMLKLGDSCDNENVIKERMDKASENDLVNILYTSGTTGMPKGVMLHQFNYTEAIRIHKIRLANITDKDTSMSFLPITHVFERAWTYLCLERGIQLYINKNAADIQKTILEVRPNLMCTVPRYWEKVYAAIIETRDAFSPILKKIFSWAMSVGRKYNIDYVRLNKKIPLYLAIKYKIADKIVFQKIKKTAGIENMIFFPCAGARLSPEINEFMHSLGINLCYGYGLTESTATVSCYLTENKEYMIESVGRIMPDVSVKISEDGEILLKGRTITAGYYKRPDANQEAFLDGWFKTGDAGYIDENNNLYITDRIKDLFKTAGGKYIAPQVIESCLSELKFIDQVAVIGNQRKYVTALIVPEFETLKIYANNNNITYTSKEELVKNSRIIELFEKSIQEKMVNFARFEQIKRFTLVTKPFTMEDGLLTNTLKIKRKEINKFFATEIEEMYNN